MAKPICVGPNHNAANLEGTLKVIDSATAQTTWPIIAIWNKSGLIAKHLITEPNVNKAEPLFN